MTACRKWTPVTGCRVDLFNQLSVCFESYETRNPGCFPLLRDCPDVVVASDYSGEHKQASFSALSFLLFDWNASAKWSSESSTVRSKFLSQGNREMAYKKLDDRCRQRALVPFLEAADSMKGLLITLLVAKRVESILEPGGVAHLRKIAPQLSDWKDGTIEKLYRIQTFLAFLLAGLCGRDQRVYWLTDDDEIAANQDRLLTSAEMLPRVARSHLGRNISVASVDTVSSMHPRVAGAAKDLASIPDLVGGALVEAWSATERDALLGHPGDSLRMSGSISQKAKVIIDWFCQTNKPLRKQVAALDLLKADQSRLSYHWLRFS